MKADKLFKGFTGVGQVTAVVADDGIDLVMGDEFAPGEPRAELRLRGDIDALPEFMRSKPKVFAVESSPGVSSLGPAPHDAVAVDVIPFVSAWAYTEGAEARKDFFELGTDMLFSVYVHAGRMYVSDGKRLHTAPCGVPSDFPTFRVPGGMLALFVRLFTLAPRQTTIRLSRDSRLVSLLIRGGPIEARLSVRAEKTDTMPMGLVDIFSSTVPLYRQHDETVHLDTTPADLLSAVEAATTHDPDGKPLPANTREKTRVLNLSLRPDRAAFFSDSPTPPVHIEGVVGGNEEFVQFADEEWLRVNKQYLALAVPPGERVSVVYRSPREPLVIEGQNGEVAVVMPVNVLKDWNHQSHRQMRAEARLDVEFASA
jgi:hypothetical protein